MIECLITAGSSGSGKTSVVVGLLSLLQRKGYNVGSFKCGPDYIDPMFHRAVMGVESHNLDLFLASADRVKEFYQRYSAGKTAVICEGAMGYFDGLGGITDEASAWKVADTLDLPVIAVIDAKGASLSIAAQILGLKALRQPHHIVGVILNKCSKMLYQRLKPVLEAETGVKLLGFLPYVEGAEFSSRHLGLYTAGEISDINQRIEKIADALEDSLDFEVFEELCKRNVKAGDGVEQVELEDSKNCASEGEDCTLDGRKTCANELGYAESRKTRANYDKPEASTDCKTHAKAKIAVAFDDAFCFLYEETLDTLKEQGAELVFFSPLHDEGLPKGVSGLYLPGGYPELFAGELSFNEDMLKDIKSAIESGLPTVAECGGFLYLCESLEDGNGDIYEQVGIFKGAATNKEKLVRFGYSLLSQEEDSLLFRKGEEVPMHEFHYWDAADPGSDLLATKPLGGRSYRCAYSTDTLYAGFPHLYLAGKPKLAARFVEKAAAFGKRRGEK